MRHRMTTGSNSGCLPTLYLAPDAAFDLGQGDGAIDKLAVRKLGVGHGSLFASKGARLVRFTPIADEPSGAKIPTTDSRAIAAQPRTPP